MAVRIIDPREMFVGEQSDRFDIKMHSNLCVPSFMHSYSMGVEYARDWFLSKMPVNYFKKENGYDSIHINEKFVFDDYRKLGKAERLKKAKPFLTITPQLNFDFDLDTVHMYNYGPNILTNSWRRDSFFRDGEKGLYLLMNMQIVELKVDYRVSLYSRAQQLDLFKKMEIWFRIGATESQDRDMDFHIPNDVICNLAAGAGFEVDVKKQRVIDSIKFARYMNSHSAFPIMYKFRKATGNFEFFLRVPMMNVHTNIMEKLRPDDGEMSGQLRTNYNIDMSATFRYAAPQFYVYYTKDPIKYEIPKQEVNPDSLSYDICTYKVVDIPLVNHLGWEKFVWSKYEYDEDNHGEIDLNEMIGDNSEFRRVLELTKSTGMSPATYLDVRLFTADPTLDGLVRIHMDWERFTIVLDQDIDPQLLYLTIYVDLNYYNNTIIGLDNALDKRMNQNLEQASKEMYMNVPSNTKKE
jgi:hypothetical protein